MERIILVRVEGFEDLQNSEGDTYTAYTIVVECEGQSWQVRRRYKHFSELYQSLREKYLEVEFFEFPQKSVFNSANEKLFRKESFHIFINLLLTLHPLPRELEHFLEVKRHQNDSFASTSRASIESFQSIYSNNSVASLSAERKSSESTSNGRASTDTETHSSDNDQSSQKSMIRLTPIALLAYTLLISTLIGSAIWITTKGMGDYEMILWVNIASLISISYLLTQDRTIRSAGPQQNEISNCPPQRKEFQQTPDSSQPLIQRAIEVNNPNDWRSCFNGKWKIIHQENAMESWYPMAGINFLIRPIALKVLMTLVKTIRVEENIIYLERSFDGKKYWRASIKIGPNKESAEVLETELDGLKSYFCCWAKETEKAIFIEFEPFDQEKGIRILHRREVLPNGQLKMNWEGYHLGTKESGVMTTYFEKIG